MALSGRIISKRRQGGICFLDLQGATPPSLPAPRSLASQTARRAGDGTIVDKATNEEVCPVVQIQAMKQDLTEKPCDFMWCVDKIKRGDIVGLQGPPRLARRSVARPLKADALFTQASPDAPRRGSSACSRPACRCAAVRRRRCCASVW